MTVDLVRYVMDCVLADHPDATPEELVDLQAAALRQHGLVT
jgi:hypothetical protein